MTAESIRKTPWASWKDPDAWMESMKGPKWEALLDEEEAIANKSIQTPSVQARLGLFRSFYESARLQGQKPLFYAGHGRIPIVYQSDFFQEWSFSTSENTQSHTSRDVCASEDGASVWTTVDCGEGAERFRLECWTADSKKPVWTHTPVGPNVCKKGSYVYFLDVKQKLVYQEVYRCDAKTGKNKEKVFQETNPEANLSLEKYPDGEIRLVSDHSQEKIEYRLTKAGTFVKTKGFESVLSPDSKGTPIFYWKQEGLMITQRHGEKTLWHNSKPLLKIPAGLILVDPWSAFEGRTPCSILVAEPARGLTAYLYHKDIGLLQESVTLPTGLEGTRISATSQDGTKAYGYVAWKRGTVPTKLMMIGYGAYGIPTSVGSFQHRWAPLLESGWMVGVTFLRGGGDHTPEWGKVGRREGRHLTLDDFEALLKATQSHFSIKPSKTCIYGRSAGGLLVGGLLARHPNGSLFRGIYTEVPYVDELRTTTNPDLPLTVLEYNEFGNPKGRLEDFLSVGLLSPADSATVLKTPSIFVLVRTASNDSQVFAYEPLKWIRRLRKQAPKGEPKLCLVDRHGGHFTSPDMQLQSWTLDMALLDSWMDSRKK